jgi:hypothetical protein
LTIDWLIISIAFGICASAGLTVDIDLLNISIAFDNFSSAYLAKSAEETIPKVA